MSAVGTGRRGLGSWPHCRRHGRPAAAEDPYTERSVATASRSCSFQAWTYIIVCLDDVRAATAGRCLASYAGLRSPRHLLTEESTVTMADPQTSAENTFSGRRASPAAPGAEPPDDPQRYSDESLTDSEIRVLRYLPTHLTAPEIAAQLYLSVHTVTTHMRHIYAKLGAHRRHEAVDRARARGLLTPVPHANLGRLLFQDATLLAAPSQLSDDDIRAGRNVHREGQASSAGVRLRFRCSWRTSWAPWPALRFGLPKSHSRPASFDQLHHLASIHPKECRLRRFRALASHSPSSEGTFHVNTPESTPIRSAASGSGDHPLRQYRWKRRGFNLVCRATALRLDDWQGIPSAIACGNRLAPARRTEQTGD
jgi:DNA-binding CsgD family transcriptional regulator